MGRADIGRVDMHDRGMDMGLVVYIFEVEHIGEGICQARDAILRFRDCTWLEQDMVEDVYRLIACVCYSRTNSALALLCLPLLLMQ